MLFSPLPGLTGEVGVGVNLHDPFAETPGRGRIGDVVGRPTGPGASVKEAAHFRFNVDNQVTRIPLG